MLFEGLAKKLKAQYSAGRKSGVVIFTESEVDEVEELGIPFEIRFAPALAKKPTKDEESATKKKPDPFAPPYIPDLFVAEDVIREEGDDQGDAFVVLLNKYCITPHHFLLVTKEFVPQVSPLNPSELVAAYSILKQLGKRQKHLCFFNSGPESGASQPHKHLQFIPLENGVAPFDAVISAHKPENPSSPFQLPLPYTNFTVLLSPSPSANLSVFLMSNFFALVDLMIDHLRRLSISHPEDPTLATFRLSSLSYNFILTENWMHIVPRRKESFILPDGEEVSINALGFAGAILTKSQEGLDGIKEIGVLKVLEGLGFPPVEHGELEEETEI